MLILSEAIVDPSEVNIVDPLPQDPVLILSEAMVDPLQDQVLIISEAIVDRPPPLTDFLLSNL